MMGHSHAITGAAGWVAVAAAAPALTNTVGGVGVTGLAAGALVAAGAAMAADLDHHNGTMTRALPPVTNLLSSIVSAISGGHRKGTHSIIGVLAAALGAFAASWWTLTINRTDYAPGPAIVSVLLAALALKALKLGFHPALNWTLSLGAGAAVWFTLPHTPTEAWTFTPTWFVLAFGVGYVIHLVGDFLTEEGIPLLWPLPVNFKLPIIGKTGSGIETIVVGASVVAAGVVLWNNPEVLTGGL